MQRGYLRARLGLRALLACAAALGALVLHGGCSNQSVGERCSYPDDNDACEDGLRCTAAKDLVDQSSPRCCPPDLSQVTAGACKPKSTQGTNTTPTGTSTSPSPEAGADAAVDAKSPDADAAPSSDGAVVSDAAAADG